MEMNLGDLEFKAEDFSPKFHAEVCRRIAEVANGILCEKLEKASGIILANGKEGFVEAYHLDEDATHTARLVCIEEIPK